jgi:3-hydroxyacyl-CoA dehydrogenase
VTFNRERLLAEAKARALELVEDYSPPEPPELHLPGESGRVTLEFALHDLEAKGVTTPHDMVVAGALSEVLTGGAKADPTEATAAKDVLALERKAIMKLVRFEATLQRMEHMLETGKPLRN